MAERNYSHFTERLLALNSPHLKIDQLGTVNDYPIFRAFLSEGTGERKNILISGGVHGDEPAGAESALRFLERDNTDLLRRFNFLVLPCVNPYGYAHNTRENAQGIDINREFAESEVAEVVCFKQVISGQQFDFFIDFHEDYDATGIYLYEGHRREQWIGDQLIEALKKVGQIDTQTGESDVPLFEGVLQVDPGWGLAGVSPYVLHTHAAHVLICETPTSWQIDQRVVAHLTALDTALGILAA